MRIAGQSILATVNPQMIRDGKDPVVTYVTARVPDGRDAERNSCITALRLKR